MKDDMTQAGFILPIAAEHPAFAGHFPGMPIVPGVVLLDEVLHFFEQELGLCAVQVSQAKFLSPVRPGEKVELRYEAGNEGSLRFHLSSAGRQIATGVVRVKANS